MMLIAIFICRGQQAGSNPFLQDLSPITQIKKIIVCGQYLGYDRGNQQPLICLHCYFVNIKIDASSKTQNAVMCVYFQSTCALVFSADVCVTMQIVSLTRKCPTVHFAL